MSQTAPWSSQEDKRAGRKSYEITNNAGGNVKSAASAPKSKASLCFVCARTLHYMLQATACGTCGKMLDCNLRRSYTQTQAEVPLPAQVVYLSRLLLVFTRPGPSLIS